jgi:hypothetical protein
MAVAGRRHFGVHREPAQIEAVGLRQPIHLFLADQPHQPEIRFVGGEYRYYALTSVSVHDMNINRGASVKVEM